MAPQVLCPYCGEWSLAWVENSEAGDGHYICENWAQFDPGIECRQPVPEEEYEELAAEARGSSSKEKLEISKEESSKAAVTLGVRKEANVAALTSGELVVRRQPLLPKVLTVSDEDPVIKKQFKSPIPGASSSSTELLRRLSASRMFVPWGSREPFRPMTGNVGEPLVAEDEQKPEVNEFPPDIEPLVLWQPDDDPARATPRSKQIVVDPHLTRFLRPHQREGVQFVFECVAGLRDFSQPNEEGESCCGCILADDMGLGKTLQSITLLWTLLQQGFDGAPLARRAVVVTPTSLVSNWESEIKKWLQDRVKVMALCESTRADVMLGLTNFLTRGSLYRVLIISYETFRIHAKRLQQPGCCDLLICDEAHRLKNDRTLTNQALAGLPCRRRILLSGTPMQNDLEEFFAMVNFTNPGILGDATAFRRYFETPILTGREPDATDLERTISTERSNELSEKVNQFILRRTNALLSNHLPPKIVEVVCCKLTDLQLKLYNHFVASKKVKNVLEENGKRSQVLASITALKKLCNHPKLIYDMMKAGGAEASGFEDCLNLFPPAVLSSRNGTWTGGDGLWIELSGKMSVLARLLSLLRRTTTDRIVLVSNYTQTLDLFGQICRERGYPFIRLDGSTGIGKRQKLVQRFNDQTQDEFAFLLSSKAGGCGLNLIGGNRLVLFDPDWNPANDKQAAARVWRDGQKKRVFIYRFLTTGTIEEKVYQRQMSKEGLQKVVDNDKASEAKAQVNLLSSEDLRDLFTLRDTRSDIHDSLTCKRCPEDMRVPEAGDSGALTCLLDAAATIADIGESKAKEVVDAQVEAAADIGRFAEVAGVADKLQPWHQQVGTPLEEELQHWGHHGDTKTIPDTIMQKAGAELVSFIFSCQIDGKLTPQDSSIPNGQRPGMGGQTAIGVLKRPLVRTAGPGALGTRPGLPSLNKVQRLQPGILGSKVPGTLTRSSRVNEPDKAIPNGPLQIALKAEDENSLRKRKRSGSGDVPQGMASQRPIDSGFTAVPETVAATLDSTIGGLNGGAAPDAPGVCKKIKSAAREKPQTRSSHSSANHSTNGAGAIPMGKQSSLPNPEVVTAGGLSRATLLATGGANGNNRKLAPVTAKVTRVASQNTTPDIQQLGVKPKVWPKPPLIELNSDSEDSYRSDESEDTTYAGDSDDDSDDGSK